MLIVFFAFAFYKNFFLFIILTTISAIIEYFTNKGQLKINIGHIFFISLLLVKIESLVFSLLFVLFAGFFPNLIVGNIDGKNIFAFPLLFILVIIVSFISEMNFVLIGLGFAFIYYLCLYFISNSLGESILEKLTEILLPIFMNLIYFISFGVSAVNLIGMVIK